jgi:hypothetical protein
MDIFIVLITIISIIVVFSRAEECYHCGSRRVARRTKFKTKGICLVCTYNGKKLP